MTTIDTSNEQKTTHTACFRLIAINGFLAIDNRHAGRNTTKSEQRFPFADNRRLPQIAEIRAARTAVHLSHQIILSERSAAHSAISALGTYSTQFPSHKLLLPSSTS